MKAGLLPRLLLAIWLATSVGCANHVFYPQPEIDSTPEQLGYDFQRLADTAEDGVELVHWLIPAVREPRRGAILFFHGNSQNISAYQKKVLWLVDAGFDVLLFEYRGYGDSGGEAELGKSMADIRQAMQHFVQQYPQDKRIVLGQSLGATMAGFVLAEYRLADDFDAVILDSAFAGYRRIMREAMAKHWLTWALQYPASLFMPARYDLLPVIDAISPTPLLIMHGRDDYVIDISHAGDLFAAAAEPKEMLTYPGRHIQGFSEAAVRDEVLDFLLQAAKQER